MADASEKVICPLCGFGIDPSDRGCRSGCPTCRHCSLVRCPRCRYSFPMPESKVVDFVKSLFPKGKAS